MGERGERIGLRDAGAPSIPRMTWPLVATLLTSLTMDNDPVEAG